MSLRSYIVKRTLHAIGVVIIVGTIVFGVIRAIPGDPVQLLLGGDAPPDVAAALREDLGLDEPVYIQYIRWWENVFQGDLGTSIFRDQPVTDIILNVAPPTVSIAVVGMLIALLIAIPLGIISATRRHETEDHAATLFAFLGISMPEFWVAILLIFATVNIGWISTYGYTPLSEGVVGWFSSIILPSIAVALPYGGTLMRMMRSSMLEELNADYVRSARAKGIGDPLVIYKHTFQNALLPVVTLAGISMAVLLGGIVAVEIVFGVNGLGQTLLNSIERRDFPVVQGTILVIATVFVFMNLFVDILYTFINPRVRYEGGE